MGESTLYQHQTLGDLMAGVFDGTLTFEELLKHGDIGIGTFHDFEGELILLDGIAYQAKEDGSISKRGSSADNAACCGDFFSSGP